MKADAHARYADKTARRAYLTHRTRTRTSSGLCRACAAPAVPGRTRCAGHLQKAVDAERSRRLGVPRGTFAALLARQGGKCAICGATDKRFHLDHDHVTGKPRGVLCESCNNGLGRFFDDPARLRAAARYLEVWHYYKD